MAPRFLVPEMTVRENGSGPVVDLAVSSRGMLQLTLGIDRVVEQESLDLSVWGSANGTQWGTRPLCSFPQKFYTGTYSIVLNLEQHPEVRWLQARWRVNRWGRGSLQPIFGLYVFAHPLSVPLAAAAAGSIG